MIANYNTIIFDCDGVILNSNKVKTQSFYKVAEQFGEDMAQELVEYHIMNGGVSRYKKFEYFIIDILKKEFDSKLMDKLLLEYATEVRKGLLQCDIAPGLDRLRKTTSSKWIVVSGGDQNELNEIFKQRNIFKYFDGGIFGSPDNKDTIFSREIENSNINGKSIYLGDSKYDYFAASKASINFSFVSNWTEVQDWKNFVNENSLESIQSLNDLVK